MMMLFENLILRTRKDRTLPELGIFMSEEIFMEADTGKQRAECQNKQRNQHDIGRFMHVVHNVMARTRLAMEGHENQAP